MGQVQAENGFPGDRHFTAPYGVLGPVHLYALSSRRWMNDAGITEDDLAAVVLQSRALARDNPRALLRDGLDEEGYRSSPMIASPLRRVDCCLESDGAVVFVVARTELLDAIRPGSPRIHAVVRGGGPGANAPERARSISDLYSSYLRAKLYEAAGIGPSDIDLAHIYDAYSPVVLQQLEDMAGCSPRDTSTGSTTSRRRCGSSVVRR